MSYESFPSNELDGAPESGLDTPVLSIAGQGDGYIDLSWGAVAGAARYCVFYSFTPGVTTDAASLASLSLVLNPGSGSNLRIADIDQTGLDITSNITVECWVKFVGDIFNDDIDLVAKNSVVSSGSYAFQFLYGGGVPSLSFALSDDGTTFVDVTRAWSPVADTWYHLAATWNSSPDRARIYVDGVQLGADEVLGIASVFDGTSDFKIGLGGAGVYTFYLDDVRVWDVERTAGEISSNRSVQLDPASEADLQGYYTMSVVGRDATANGNHLSEVGSIAYDGDVPFEITGTSFRHLGLESGAQVYYIMVARTAAAGRCGFGAGTGVSAASDEESGVALGAPTLSVAAGDGENVVTFTFVAGATSYNLYFGASGAGLGGTKITGATTPYTHTGLTNGVEVCYVATAVVGGSESDASNEDCGTPAAVGGTEDIVLLMGGVVGTNEVNMAALYDTGAGTWTSGVNMPIGRDGAFICKPESEYAFYIAGETLSAIQSTGYFYNHDLDVYGAIPAFPEVRNAASAIHVPGSVHPSGTDRFFIMLGADALGTGGATNTSYVIDPNSGYASSALAVFPYANGYRSAWVGLTSKTTDGNPKLVIISGEISSSDPNYPSCTGDGEDKVFIYDITTDTWSQGADISGFTTGGGVCAFDSTLDGHSMIVMDDGRILTVGGKWESTTPSFGALADCLIYDAELDTWTATGPLSAPRMSASVLRLANGKIMAVGGQNTANTSVATCELYDQALGTWTTAAPMSIAREAPFAILLSSGKVLVAGGKTGGSTATSTCEIYDPDLDTWTATGALPTAADRGDADIRSGVPMGGGGMNGLMIVDTY